MAHGSKEDGTNSPEARSHSRICTFQRRPSATLMGKGGSTLKARDIVKVPWEAVDRVIWKGSWPEKWAAKKRDDTELAKARPRPTMVQRTPSTDTDIDGKRKIRQSTVKAIGERAREREREGTRVAQWIDTIKRRNHPNRGSCETPKGTQKLHLLALQSDNGAGMRNYSPKQMQAHGLIVFLYLQIMPRRTKQFQKRQKLT
jgi:hypothetical protein